MYETEPWLRYAWSKEKHALEAIVRICREKRGVRKVSLLDFACGTGRIISALENTVEEAVGVDVAEPMLSLAWRKVKRATLIRANLLEENCLAGRSFDLITAFRFFANAEPPLRFRALQVLSALLKPDGLLVFNNHHNQGSLYFLARAFVTRLHRTSCETLLTFAECQRMIESVGLQIVHVFPVGVLHVPKMRLPWLLHAMADAVSELYPRLAAISESPIIVCRRRSATGP